MLKRIVLVWAIANFILPGLAAALAGGWYLGWHVSPMTVMIVELGLIMVPNLVLPILVLRYAWPEVTRNLREALGWRWAGWRSLGAGLLAFGAIYILNQVVGVLAGGGIPYSLPGATGEAVTVHGLPDLLKLLGILLALAGFVVITVAAEETMFRGWIQTQVGRRYGALAGMAAGALLFGLRHLPADLFYARLWQATPQMWLARELGLYLAAAVLALARHFGKSTYASALTHGLLLVSALFGLG